MKMSSVVENKRSWREVVAMKNKMRDSLDDIKKVVVRDDFLESEWWLDETTGESCGEMLDRFGNLRMAWVNDGVVFFEEEPIWERVYEDICDEVYWESRDNYEGY